MRLPLARYGIREVAVFGGGLFVAATAAAVAGGLTGKALLVYVAAGLYVVTAWVLSFFRDPERRVPTGEALLVAPADGRVVEVSHGQDEAMGCECVRIGIFLSIFNVHINRAPADGKVAQMRYRQGRFLNAMRGAAATENEANLMVLSLDGKVDGRIGIRQIAGTIARRIVCEAKVGDNLCRGEKYGMIKFGSRTELLVPVTIPCQVTVSVGQKVKAGQSVVAELRCGA